MLIRVNITIDGACNLVQATLTPSLQGKESNWGGEVEHSGKQLLQPTGEMLAHVYLGNSLLPHSCSPASTRSSPLQGAILLLKTFLYVWRWR